MKSLIKIELYLLVMCISFMASVVSCAEESDEDDEITVTDIEGNIYKTVTIGDQVWMAENLRTARFNDGTGITNIQNSAAWSTSLTSAYCWYMSEDEETFEDIYGFLYNWAAVNTGKLCPTGWHVSSTAEWMTLINFLGGESVAGNKLKEAGTMHWKFGNISTNESGFTALPGGIRLSDGTFAWIKTSGIWWTTDGGFMNAATSTHMIYNQSWVHTMAYLYECGLSVRCVKD